MIKKIVILGPESTGKSTLCAQLAEHYNSSWVKEYAREYLLTNGTGYTFPDLLDIARGQVALEDAAIAELVNRQSLVIAGAGPSGANANLPLFIDTNMYVLKVWCEFVFNRCHSWILNQVVERPYDLYLLCDIDLPWVKDELREYPDLHTRELLYHYYKDIMVNQPLPWVNINGNYAQRLEKAISAVDELIR
jgi:NadR type nicotinamide-nucleotide adenylyltransferase